MIFRYPHILDHIVFYYSVSRFMIPGPNAPADAVVKLVDYQSCIERWSISGEHANGRVDHFDQRGIPGLKRH